MKRNSSIRRSSEHARRRDDIAQFDVLTGLPDRVMLGDRLHQAITESNLRGKRLAVACIELNGLKTINDRQGHKAGDRVLRSLTIGMKRVLREGDTLARLGGAEFAAVLLDLPDAEACAPLLICLLEAAGEPVETEGFSFPVSARAGVTFYPQAEAADADQLLRQAGQAMKKAKAAGPDRVHFFDPADDHNKSGHHESLHRIRQAITARQFVIYYQPIVNMSTGAVVGAEALVRWQHPQRGLLPPTEFLPIIEDHALAVELGEWIIDKALTQMEDWVEAGLDMPVSVNVGARQLKQADFVDRLAALLARHPRIKPSRLELEILESNALEGVAQLSGLLAACRAIGVSSVLDDFGTGHSSLSDLKHSPASVVKIDRSFVHNILDSPDDLTMLEGILGLAAAFRRQSIAEGVESIDHGLMLLNIGCAFGQGYGIAPPMPAEDFPGWVAAWRPDPRWTEALSVSQDDRPLLYAGSEHRAWITAIENFLKGESVDPPWLSRRQCQLGVWLEVEGQAGRGSQPDFQAIVAVHWRLHALATGISKLHDQGLDLDALPRLDEMKGLMEKLLGHVEVFKQKSKSIFNDDAG